MNALTDANLRLSQCLTRSLIAGFSPVQHESYAALVTDILASPAPETAIGTDEGGLTIYKLDMGLEALPIFFLSCNQHGSEFATAELALEFARRWVEDTAPEFVWLRSNFRLVCIPSLNPTGYDGTTYTNANTVNLNRNWDYNWAAYPVEDPPVLNYKGTAPFSESETRVARDLFQTLDPLLAVDLHTSAGAGGIDAGGPYAPLLLAVDRTLTVLSPMATIAWGVRSNPTATAWYNVQTSSHGYTCISSLLEFTPDETGAAYAMTALYLIARQAYTYYALHV